MEKLFTLLDLQRQVQDAPSLAAFSHIAANDTRKLIDYDEAIVWTQTAGFITLQQASGNASLDVKAPFAQGLKVILRQAIDVINSEQAVFRVPPDAMSTYLERARGSALIVMFRDRKKNITGGLWLYREKEFTDAEEKVMAELSHGYGVALMLLMQEPGMPWRRTWKNTPRIKRFAFAGLILLALFPVRLSVSAPAEIVARDARVISVPFDGIVETILVAPGEKVIAGQSVAVMEQTALKARMDMAQESLSTAQAALSRIRRDALANPDKRVEMMALQSDIAVKKLEYDYATSLLKRAELTAPHDGIAVFSDRNSLMGKPARTGDVLMQIADPSQKELLVRIPADALIPLSLDSALSFHLNVSPLSGYRARIDTIGYQASPDPDGLLTYKVRAALNDTGNDMRIGWKGTARLKGDWTILSYALARRPIAALRRALGW